MSKTYTLSEAAARLGISPRRLRSLFPDFDVGAKRAGVWFFTEEDIEALRGRNKRRGRPRGVEWRPNRCVNQR